MTAKPVLKQRDINVPLSDQNAGRKKVGFSAKEKQVQGFSSKTAPSNMIDIDDICSRKGESFIEIRVPSKKPISITPSSLVEEEITWDVTQEYSDGFSLGHLTHEVKVGRDTETMSAEELRKELKQLHLDTKGTRSELQRRLEDYLQDQAEQPRKGKRKTKRNDSKAFE